jgi:hypothetical protein
MTNNISIISPIKTKGPNNDKSIKSSNISSNTTNKKLAITSN